MKNKKIIIVGILVFLQIVMLTFDINTKVQGGQQVRIYDNALGFITPFGNTDWQLVDTKRQFDAGWIGTTAPYRKTIYLNGNTNVSIEASGIMDIAAYNIGTGSIGIFVNGNAEKVASFYDILNTKDWTGRTFLKFSKNYGAGEWTIELKIKTIDNSRQALISRPELIIEY